MEFIFYVLSLLLIISTFRVITHTQSVHALLYLIISSIVTACIFFLLGAYFAGALEIIIYAGAVMVLFIFVIMMLNVDFIPNKQKYSRLRFQVWIKQLFLPVILLLLLSYVLSDIDDHYILREPIIVKAIGTALFSSYILATELASILLLTGILVSFHVSHYGYINTNDFSINKK